MAWFTRKKQNLKKETLKRKPFQNLRNKYTNIKSSVKNYFGERRAKKEGKPYHRTEKIAESRRKTQSMQNRAARAKEYKAEQAENRFTNENLKAELVEVDNLTNKNIGDMCTYITSRMDTIKEKLASLTDDEDPRRLSQLYNAYSTKFSEYDCEEEKDVENIFPGPKTPPPPSPQSIVPEINLEKAVPYPGKPLTLRNLGKRVFTNKEVTEYMKLLEKEDTSRETRVKEMLEQGKRPRFYQPPLKPYGKGGSRKRRSIKRRGRKYTRKH